MTPLPPPVLLVLDPSNPESVAGTAARAGDAVAGGAVVVLPAEGLYGYHVLAGNAEARARLAVMKPSEARRGWIVLLAEPRLPAAWGGALEGRAAELAGAHWPGPLTLVLTVPPATPPLLRSADGTLAFRCPGSYFLREVVAKAGGPLLSTSANRPGEAAPRRIEECALSGVDLAVDGGALSGLPSTVARVVGNRVEILRDGAISLEER